jgi:hypothetical protein
MLDLMGLRELSVTPRAIANFLALTFTFVFTHSALVLTTVSTVLPLV